ncbi:hypothetical protein OsI_20754 [Oryza sativa Indica Group]|uniref:serine O-acetyltransferase n=1 Tax=Oryza sativa subsp. indica TaxID=39946 RepID=A2Y6U9_ORYSI|nr:hypothetical protein OsI_20754 [Oryza sativa Indica Group]
MPAGQPHAHEPDGGGASHRRPQSPPSLPAEVVPAFAPPESEDEESWVWSQIKAEARRDADAEPALASFLYASVALPTPPSRAPSPSTSPTSSAPPPSSPRSSTTSSWLPSPRTPPSARVVADLLAARSRDPACVGFSQCLLNFKGFLAIQAHRVSHVLWAQQRRPLALALQSRVADVFAVDIHPAAVVGKGILLDHATGVVIGETAVVGDNVSILHHVTLGGTGKAVGDRHPKIGDGVLIGAGATILGNVKIGAGAKIGAGSVVLIDVPARNTAVGNPARLIGRKNGEVEKDEDMPGESMDHTSFIRQWSDYTI